MPRHEAEGTYYSALNLPPKKGQFYPVYFWGTVQD